MAGDVEITVDESDFSDAVSEAQHGENERADETESDVDNSATHDKSDMAKQQYNAPGDGTGVAVIAAAATSKLKYDAKDPHRPRRKKARRACYACQRAHLTCGKSFNPALVIPSRSSQV